MSGTGTIDNPWDLITALHSNLVGAGDTLLLRGGEYIASTKSVNAGGSDFPGKGVFGISVCGTPDAHITIKPYPGETVKISGGLELFDTAGYIDFLDLEIAPIPTTRSFATSDDVDFPHAVLSHAPGCSFTNCYIHDGRNMGIQRGAPFILQGCIVMNIGYWSDDEARWRDYDIYTSNHNGGPVILRNNMWGPPASEPCVNLYSDSYQNVVDYTVEDSIFYGGGFFADSITGLVERNIFRNNLGCVLNYGYRSGKHLRLGSGGIDNPNKGSLLVENNYWIAQNAKNFSLGCQRLATVRSNTFIHLDGVDRSVVSQHINSLPATNVIGPNTYINKSDPARFAVNGDEGTYETFAQWQSRGYDLESTLSTNLPTVNHTKVVQQGHWMFVGIVNWEELETVSVDVGLPEGEYLVRNALNFTETTTLECDAEGNITFPMTGWTLAKMIGNEALLVTDPYPFYGIFVIEV